MKLTKKAIEVLHNFAAISNSIYIKEGSVLCTKTVNNHTYADATVDTVFTDEMGIYNLGKFLSVVKALGSDCEIDVDNDVINIRNGKTQTTIENCNAATIVHPKKQAVFPDSDVTFELPNVIAKEFYSLSGALGIEFMRFKSENDKVLLLGVTAEGQSVYRTTVGDFDSALQSFDVYLRVNHIKMVECDYKVLISKLGIGKFEGDVISYIIAMEEKSELI